jgi:uncharacterized repeat protein (TIGR01451 family)
VRAWDKRRIVALVAAGYLLAAAPLFAAVLTTINVDGDTSDWSVVLADPFQTSYDGPAAGLPDADAPVQSTGRDLTTFAWTYDATYLYFYVARTGSAANQQLFWFYLDIDEDDRMETGEPVIGVTWKGSNRSTVIDHYHYVAASPGGDPLGDPAGQADGWDMPGTVVHQGTLESPKGGSSSGIEMESRVAWSVLGVPSGTPLRFHVASSNSPNLPSQLDDNMGGPGGVVGTTRLAGVLIRPDRTGTIVPNGTCGSPHTVTNTGASADTFDLTWTWSGDFAPSAVAFHHDANGNGLLDPSDPPLTDTDGSGQPDTGILAPAASLPILTVVSAPGGVVNGQVVTVVTTATSVSAPLQDSANDVVTVAIPELTLVKAVDKATAVPGEVLTYSVNYTSSGAADAHNVVLVDAIPADTVYVLGSAAGAGTVIEFSHDGGATFDASETAPITHLRWTLAAPLAPGGSGVVTFQSTLQ